MNPTYPERERGHNLRLALRLEALSVACMGVELIGAVGAGYLAKSVLLVAFGVDSGVELTSACLLYWRLKHEARAGAGDEARIAAVERRTAVAGGWLLCALSAYVIIQAAYGLLHRNAAQTSWLGTCIAIIAAGAMPLLARAKINIADRIGSRALRIDAVETLTCGYLSWVLLAGLVANALLHWWWLDSAAALLLVPLLLREAREALSGEGCHCGPGADCS